MNKPISLTEFILDEEKRFPKAKGNFTLLLSQLEYAGKIIASHLRKAGLVDILGKTGEKNVYEEEVVKLDQLSNDILLQTLTSSQQVHAVASEELEDIHVVEKHNGEYLVFLDPLDGSSNVDVNLTIGTIFSIYHRSDSLLQPGNKQVASGYILYGTSVMFVYTSGKGVHGFTLDPSIGTFLLSHPDIRIPDEGDIYSLSEANSIGFDGPMTSYLQSMKQGRKQLKARYSGTMVADMHRVLLKGGIFLYPSDPVHYPEGKLRLLFEVNPLSFLIQHAGGKAVCRRGNPLEITPESLHQRSDIAIGSRKNVEEYESFLNG
ncbi:MAG: class 1 fructose-bisphosphatase [bacterium]|nr:class 1 fructose-bisphosphatase [bacterium]